MFYKVLITTSCLSPVQLYDWNDDQTRPIPSTRSNSVAANSMIVEFPSHHAAEYAIKQIEAENKTRKDGVVITTLPLYNKDLT